MHEFSLSQSIARHLIDICEKNNTKRIIKAKVAIKKDSCINKENIRFCFDLVKKDYTEIKDTIFLISIKNKIKNEIILEWVDIE